MRTQRIVFWVATGLLSAMMLMSVGMYIFNNEEISKTFEALGHPSYIVYPLAVAKLLGVVALLTRKSKPLVEWAYAGFFFNFVLAAAAHIDKGDEKAGGAFVAIALLLVSYSLQRKLFK